MFCLCFWHRIEMFAACLLGWMSRKTFLVCFSKRLKGMYPDNTSIVFKPSWDSQSWHFCEVHNVLHALNHGMLMPCLMWQENSRAETVATNANEASRMSPLATLATFIKIFQHALNQHQTDLFLASCNCLLPDSWPEYYINTGSLVLRIISSSPPRSAKLSGQVGDGVVLTRCLREHLHQSWKYFFVSRAERSKALK